MTETAHTCLPTSAAASSVRPEAAAVWRDEPVTGDLSPARGRLVPVAVCAAVSSAVWPAVFTPTPTPTPARTRHRSTAAVSAHLLSTAKDPLMGVSPRGKEHIYAQ
jgi:hypothetical protein